MVDGAIRRWKDWRSRRWLGEVYGGQYAFVGIGWHSLANLYPVLQHLQVPLKYICCRSAAKAVLIEAKYRGVRATTSLADVLADESVRGVLVSASPTAHFAIAKQVLESGRHLFVEKPPCQSLGQLEQLIVLAESHNTIAVTGLQKRYSPVMTTLKARLAKERLVSYNAHYVTGAYPEGDAVLDLFIHPIDALIFLFGPAEIAGLERTHGTILLTLRHSGVSGIVELSTDYTWADAAEALCVNTERGIYRSRQMQELTFSPKGGTILGVPREKVMPRHPVTIDLLRRNNFVPTLANNQVLTQGYYAELKAFFDAAEGKAHAGPSQLAQLRDTYRLLAQLRP